MNAQLQHGGILIDEIKLSENFIKVDHNGKVAGFVDLGDFTSSEMSSVPADHGFVLFQPFKGKWRQVVGVFESRGNVKTAMLAWIIVEAVILAESASLLMDFVTTDAASWNRIMWHIFEISGTAKKVVCKTVHPTDPARHLHFASDFPHLTKNVRNNALQHLFKTPEGEVLA
ncbi:hypothetical protein HPB47_026302 [Ixodes persulcatus]|uniref:Uncharacterized protein n=1 Tax=Ixodes persulcatus TaxID=34615 RepID=A0AC60PZ32_IXOPE|nr:hypothetical protein HPB47_026302 [Ixodes persulcatus]